MAQLAEGLHWSLIKTVVISSIRCVLRQHAMHIVAECRDFTRTLAGVAEIARGDEAGSGAGSVTVLSNRVTSMRTHAVGFV